MSDQDSVVSGQTLVDGTHLAPQQLGLMGMEALETVIGYWEDALGAYSPASRQLVLTTAEETQFIRSIEEILELAYSLQESSEQLFIHQNSVLNKHKIFFIFLHISIYLGTVRDSVYPPELCAEQT